MVRVSLAVRRGGSARQLQRSAPPRGAISTSGRALSGALDQNQLQHAAPVIKWSRRSRRAYAYHYEKGARYFWQ